MVPLKWWACTDADATSHSPCRPEASLILRGVSFSTTQKRNEGGRAILVTVRLEKTIKNDAALYCSRLESTTFRENVTFVFFLPLSIATLYRYESVADVLSQRLRSTNKMSFYRERRIENIMELAISFQNFLPFEIFWITKFNSFSCQYTIVR